MSDTNERSVASTGSTGCICSKAKSVLRVASAASIRNGEYLGEWSGYKCHFETHDDQYVVELERGIRGTSDCVVSVWDGDITAMIVVGKRNAKPQRPQAAKPTSENDTNVRSFSEAVCTLLEMSLSDATVNSGLQIGMTAEEIACRLAEDKKTLTERLAEWESTAQIKLAAMLAALKRQQANIRRWLETGVSADADESRSISEQIDEAIKLAEGGR